MTDVSPDLDTPLLDHGQLRLPERPGTDPVALFGGVSAVIGLALLLVALPTLARLAPATPRERGQPLEYVEARVLRLGEIKDDTKLPDRIVPPLPTAPAEVLPLDQDETRLEPPPPADQARPRDAVDDQRLREVMEKARAFAEIQDDYLPEGRAEGVREGDVTDPALASLGATYGLRIKAIITELWVVPTLLAEDDLARLRVKVALRVDIDMRIVDAKLLGSSGNTLFDDSVQLALDRLQTEVRTLPAPPEALAPRIFGGGLTITFNGSEANR